ncbi:MAG: tRNA (adenosine(37)-N6)-threonylcarbamoyltransferase complex transferase subunit TsaD [Magnetococcales bacterium]|nr:tRNA (adenosine(37)-N6)-threonylcarbamoyltransferase complex transferase subunit TsaD [Magnetococcales bacterium]
MNVLGLETSCDETAAGVVSEGRMLSNVIRTQVAIHAEFGGVVPELASRAHIRNVQPVVEAALAQAQMASSDLDGIAVTAGPGLAGGLLVGLSTAKGLAMALGIPLIGVNHMEGHLMSPFLMPEGGEGMQFPFIALLVSGGHTMLVQAHAFGRYEIMGQTRDDAVGEAFDKGARMMALPYPGGPSIAALAEGGDRGAYVFPRALMTRRDGLDFSYSGVKTSLRQFLRRHEVGTEDARRPDIAASYQEALVEALVNKSLKACHESGHRRLMVAGGVGANRRLREMLSERAGKVGIQVYFPPLDLCTDNGAMIAYAGARRLERGERSGWDLNADPRWGLTALSYKERAREAKNS